MMTYFVLTLYCLSCQPMQILEVHHIPAFMGGSTAWADLQCKTEGDILSGDYERRNMDTASPAGSLMASRDFIIYTCAPESGEI